MTDTIKSLLTKVQALDTDVVMITILTASIFLPFYFSVGAVAITAILITMNYEKRQKAFSAPYTKFLLGFLLVPFFVAAVYNNYTGMVYALLMLAIVLCGMYLRSVMTRPLFNQMMDLACLLSVACALIAGLQKLSMYAAHPDYRPVSTFTNANYYGMMIEFCVLVAMYRMMTNVRYRKLYLAVIAFNLGGLYLAASLSSFAALCCGVVVMLMLKQKRKTAVYFMVGVLAFFALTFVFPLLFPRVEAIDYTFNQRLSIWGASVKAIEQHFLLGQGAMAYQLVYPVYGGYPTAHSHNLLLDVLLNFGVVGLVAFSAYAVTQGRLLLMRFRNSIFNNMNILIAAVAAATFAHGITDVTIFWVQTGMMFLLVFSSIGIGSGYLERKLLVNNLLLPSPAVIEGRSAI